MTDDDAGLGDELFGTPMGDAPPGNEAGPRKGDFIPPPDVTDSDEPHDALPEQEEFWRAPVRFGSIPVETEPLGWDRRRGFRKAYPQVMLPTQVVERVSFGHPELKPNRLFWGDNLHVMRSHIEPESIDLIYLDPPFFSGRNYNVIFGDQNELRSFTDIWEAGMPGYIVWLNARLMEMKRILSKRGSIFVHLDWHASHYVKQELDKIFGYSTKPTEPGFKNEIVWCYSIGGKSKKMFARKHDVILWYTKSGNYIFNGDDPAIRVAKKPDSHMRVVVDEEGVEWQEKTDRKSGKVYRYPLDKIPEDYWTDIEQLNREDAERIGYPTQKPSRLLERIILACTEPGGVVADFFVGGGTTPAVAQRLGRRWLAADQSRVAVAITADRLATTGEQMTLEIVPSQVPDFTIEHWGIYEASRLSQTPRDQFCEFVMRAYGAAPAQDAPGIHGHKGAVPVWVGEPSQRSQVTSQEVQDFANAVRKTVRYQHDNLRDGIMLGWAFRPDAVEAAEKLRAQEETDLNFIRLDLLRIDSPKFREHVTSLATDKADYSTFLTFVQPPQVEVGYKRVTSRTFKFDVSETAVLNPGAKIINVQWDFDYGARFTSTQGYSFVRTNKKEPALIVEYTFPRGGKHRIACKVQDDAGGEGIWIGELEV